MFEGLLESRGVKAFFIIQLERLSEGLVAFGDRRLLAGLTGLGRRSLGKGPPDNQVSFGAKRRASEKWLKLLFALEEQH